MMVLGDACAGFGSCLLRSAMPAADLGQVVLSSSQLQIDDSGDVFIEYYTNSTSQTTDCTGHGTSTTVRFRCPGRQLVSLTCLEIVVVSIVQLRELHTPICITLSGSLFSLLSVSFFVIRTTVSILYSLSFTTGWKSAQVVNSHLVWDPTIRQLGFDLARQQWSLLNCFCTERGHCRRKWRLTDTDLCPCGETQTMSHIVESCPLTKLNGGLSWLHSAEEDAVSWLTSHGSWHAYKKKKTTGSKPVFSTNLSCHNRVLSLLDCLHG